ncbi:Protein of unknown function [Pyronema omphalodes CBS 100304]|uniref:Uncharacterized protein n=1 Tax=Pyronema omphalodes (strain CBS 100304) TaxID=1076935 RepID=U4KUG7_PYROM|nr:Protein of unknown function [Pyronema omphalodes CBS 100304]
MNEHNLSIFQLFFDTTDILTNQMVLILGNEISRIERFHTAGRLDPYPDINYPLPKLNHGIYTHATKYVHMRLGIIISMVMHWFAARQFLNQVLMLLIPT